jgi:hypothetical protein
VTAVATAALAPWPLPGIRPSKSPASDRGLGRPPPR